MAGWVTDHVGRKASLLLSGLPYTFGYLMLAYARFVSTAAKFQAVMLTGRFLTGFSLGWSCLVVPVRSKVTDHYQAWNNAKKACETCANKYQYYCVYKQWLLLLSPHDRRHLVITM